MTQSRIPPPDSVFLGYRIKIPWKPDAAWKAGMKNGEGVEEVCSVSDCFAKPPTDWVERWDFNKAVCYATREEARATLPVGAESASWKLFAYALIPLKFSTDHPPVVVSVDEIFPDGLPSISAKTGVLPLRPLGYDVVALMGAEFLGYGCSPLSCNGLANEIPVNRHCLIDELDSAIQTAARFQEEQPEPEDYYIVEVFKVEES